MPRKAATSAKSEAAEPSSPKSHKKSPSISKSHSRNASASSGASKAVVAAAKQAAKETKAEVEEKTSWDLRSKLPESVKFPLAAVLSFAIMADGYSLLGWVSKGDLAAVTRSQDTWLEFGIMTAWKLIELGVSWFGGLDSVDVISMTLLSHGPALYLQSVFYGLTPQTALYALSIEAVSLAVPFLLLRHLSPVHSPFAKTPNKELIDISTQFLTSALATGIYSVTTVLSLRMLLPKILVAHFTGLPSLEPAYSASYTAVLPATLAFGIAASNFVFPPFATTTHAPQDDEVSSFDPVAADLKQTVWWNVWGYTAKTKVVIERTAALAFVTGVNTYLTCSLSMYGVDTIGAAAYALVWVFAAASTGMALGLVGGV